MNSFNFVWISSQYANAQQFTYNFFFILYSEEECYHCLASLVAARDKVFITQTKLLYEVTWKTVMQIAKKYAVSHLNILC